MTGLQIERSDVVAEGRAEMRLYRNPERTGGEDGSYRVAIVDVGEATTEHEVWGKTYPIYLAASCRYEILLHALRGGETG